MADDWSLEGFFQESSPPPDLIFLSKQEKTSPDHTLSLSIHVSCCYQFQRDLIETQPSGGRHWKTKNLIFKFSRASHTRACFHLRFVNRGGNHPPPTTTTPLSTQCVCGKVKVASFTSEGVGRPQHFHPQLNPIQRSPSTKNRLTKWEKKNNKNGRTVEWFIIWI